VSSAPVIIGIGETLWDVYPDAAHFGGAPANFACHAAGLGAASWMVSAVGTDTLGDRAIEALEERSVCCTHVTRDAAHATGRVSVTLDAAGLPQYEIEPDTAWDYLRWTSALGERASRCDAVCFGTLGQRSPVSRETIRRFLEAVPRSALRVYDVNLRQHFYDRQLVESSLRLASAVKLNDEELPVVAALCEIPHGAPFDMLGALMSRYDLRLAALTCGSRGALLRTELDEDECPAPTLAAAADTVGAGDAFTATMVIGYLAGLPLKSINRHANAVASFVCSQAGATPSLPQHLRLST
jgi:fructokinase